MFVMPPLEGAILDGRYLLTHKLGEGAFGLVYSAQQIFLDEVVGHVAVKFLSPPTEEARNRVLEEVRAMARLSHPNLLSFRSAGVVDVPGYQDDLFLVCELASDSLDSALKVGLFDVEETLKLARQLALGLEYLAKNHCVHRDLKPANVLRVNDEWKIADFGLARTLENSMSLFSGVGGTPLFMAPEAWRGHISPAVDVWALGALLQLASTGNLPYERQKTQDAFLVALRKNPPFLSPSLTSPLREIVEGCLRKDPAKRWDASQILQHLASGVAPAKTPLPQHIGSQEDIVVAQDGSGDFETLREAIENAFEGATIRVAPGTYQESIVLNKELHIVGADVVGDARPVFEAASGNVCKIEGSRGSIRGCSFRSVAGEFGKRFFAMSILNGVWELMDCDVFSDSLAALRVGGTADLKLMGCHFQSERMDGILIEGGQILSVLECHAIKNGRHGLHLKGALENRLQLQGCIFEENRANGSLVTGGQVEVEKCSFSNNQRAGIELEAQAHAEITRCRLSGNGAQGLIATSESTGEVTLCDLSDNRFGAFDVPRDSLFACLKNKE